MRSMMKEDKSDTLFENLSQELRRGVLVLATLSQLGQPKYGYALIDRLGERGLEIDQGTIYPLLRRLEGQGLLDSEWNVEGSRPRRYYVLSAEGEQLLEALKVEWGGIIKVMEVLLSGASNGG